MKHFREVSTRSELYSASLKCITKSGKSLANMISLFVDMDVMLGNGSFVNVKNFSTMNQDQQALRPIALESRFTGVETSGQTGEEESDFTGDQALEHQPLSKKRPKVGRAMPVPASPNPKEHIASHASCSYEVTSEAFKPFTFGAFSLTKTTSPSIGCDVPMFNFGLNCSHPSSSTGHRPSGSGGMAKGKGKLGASKKHVGPNVTSSRFATLGQKTVGPNTSGHPLHSEGKHSWAHVTVKVFDLPMECWNHDALRFITSGIGKPLALGEITEDTCIRGNLFHCLSDEYEGHYTMTSYLPTINPSDDPIE
ncbi:hypothetical protein Patl1_25715 [Pistacia atlantica]|uniref:Uncharacterized protein n=1 Tax=Pistacia atlantica TaxID=434234 RepID=A0ACC1B3W9_9ROSI|nr:hypothetical protein Patl1_25715 [Pistacia atlantica]